jgi:hypothetical protein
MTSLDPTATRHSSLHGGMPLALRLAPALYAVTLCASALLLFAIQPMFTKMVLPQLGGSPSVWSVAMVFFQTALLAGYAYAHWLMRLLGPVRAAFVHFGLLACAATTLPIGIASGFGAPPTDGIALWLFALFAVSIGLPFAVLAASAPLLQSWFALSGHRQAGNPYVLYAASNLGSFAALMAYPVVLEPLLSLRMQAQVWSVGFALLAALIAAAAIVLVRSSPAASLPRQQTHLGETISWISRARWIALAAVPSGLVIAVTAHVTTDVAAAPFLWVIPLALYLLTFVAVFRERPWISHAVAVRLMPFVIAPLAISVIGGNKVFWLATIALNLVAFVMMTLVCHGELYARRPAPERLTSFYLWTSFGGVLGGAFAGLLAPNIFNGTYEYPILIAAAVLAAPGMFAGGRRKWLRQALPILAVAAALTLVWFATPFRLPDWSQLIFQIALIFPVGWMLLRREQPGLFFALVVLCFVLTEFWWPGLERVETTRSFFGVHKVAEIANGKVRLLYHGTTLHGAERVKADDGTPVTGTPEPLTYYYFGGPIGDAIQAARDAQHGLKRVAAIGLGTGSLACHRQAGEDWTFFEIDAAVAHIARDPSRFRFLSSCAPDAPIILGDARLTLTASEGRYDVIVLDAFSSDAIPVHLLTREALAGYLTKLSSHGVIVMHISNRHMALAPVVAAVAAADGLVTWLKEDKKAGDFLLDYHANAHVAVVARSDEDLGSLRSQPGWNRVQASAADVWTDDFSNILGAIWRKKAGH